uniref:Prefoldin subunit n=1 Tax=Riptortus pedestris TaxID=329032 RepID=R4WNS9_RIPPE|nr:prefoldin subunit [Riptortus pedestris]
MSAKDKPEMQQIDLNKLNLQQLTQLKKQFDQDLSVYQDSLQTLKMAQTKYSDSRESLEKITPSSAGTEIMVPLTGSMFVPGQIADAEKVLIDVGTGYYLQVSVDSAKDYFKRKVAFVTEQMEKIQVIGLEKTKIREAIVDVMEMKIQQQLAAQRALQQSAVKT